MNFKETLQKDLETFVNINEFGEMVTLDEVELPAVVTYSTGEYSGEQPSNFNTKKTLLHGVNLVYHYLTIYFRAADYGRRIPKQSEFIKFNGRRLKVQESLELEGLVKLTCSGDAMNTPKMPNVFGGSNGN